MQTHPSADNWVKALLSMSLPTRARPSTHLQSLPHQEAYTSFTSFLASSTKGQTEETDRTKTTLKKVNQDEKAEGYVPDKVTRKTTKCSGDRQASRKRIQNDDSEVDPGSWKQNEEDARNVYQRPRRTKEQGEMK